jgi:hypothetical protein
MMYGRSLVGHVHFEVLHVHHSMHDSMEFSRGVLCCVHASMNVLCLECMHGLRIHMGPMIYAYVMTYVFQGPICEDMHM